MVINYKIVTIEEAQLLDFATLMQDSVDTAKRNVDFTKIVISGFDIVGVSLEEIMITLTDDEWNYDEII